jgi:hypothetical protein
MELVQEVTRTTAGKIKTILLQFNLSAPPTRTRTLGAVFDEIHRASDLLQQETEALRRGMPSHDCKKH